MTDLTRHYWDAAEIQVPEGDSWTTVYTYHYPSGEPAEAAWWVVRYGYVRVVGARQRHAALAELPAAARVVLIPATYNRQDAKPVTVPVRDAFLAVLRARATERRAALATAEAAADAAKAARLTAQVAGYDLEDAVAEAKALGMADAAIRKVTAAPRKRR